MGTHVDAVRLGWPHGVSLVLLISSSPSLSSFFFADRVTSLNIYATYSIFTNSTNFIL